MIQNPVFFVYNVILLSIVYAIVLSQAVQAHASRKSQRLIHVRVTRYALRVVWLGVKFGHVIRNSIGNEIWSIYDVIYFEIWTFFS